MDAVDGGGAPVVVGIDGSAGSRAALVWAIQAAGRRGRALTVIAAFPVELYWMDPHLVDAGQVEAVRADVDARARTQVEQVRADPLVAAQPGVADLQVTVIATPGQAAATLVRAAAEADLLVVGSRGRGVVRSAVLGSVALHCAAHAPCPVVVVRPRSEVALTPPRIVVGLDGSDVARAALRSAVAEADRLGAAVQAVSAFAVGSYWSDVYQGVLPSVERLRDDVHSEVERMVAEVGAGTMAVAVAAIEGSPGEVLVREAEGAELLVVGDRGHSPLAGLMLGSVALHCMVHAPCPVMVVPLDRAGVAE